MYKVMAFVLFLTFYESFQINIILNFESSLVNRSLFFLIFKRLFNSFNSVESLKCYFNYNIFKLSFIRKLILPHPTVRSQYIFVLLTVCTHHQPRYIHEYGTHEHDKWIKYYRFFILCRRSG